MFAYSLPHPPWRGERVVVTVVRAFKGCGIPDVPSWERGPTTARSACLLLQMEELRPRVTCLRCPSRARTQCLHHPLQHQVVVEVSFTVTWLVHLTQFIANSSWEGMWGMFGIALGPIFLSGQESCGILGHLEHFRHRPWVLLRGGSAPPTLCPVSFFCRRQVATPLCPPSGAVLRAPTNKVHESTLSFILFFC